LDNPIKVNKEVYNNIQSIVLLSCYIYHEPRRSEYINIKISNYNSNIDNYILIGDIIVLNEYKGAKRKGKYIIQLKDYNQLNNILNKFINFRNINSVKSDWLFTSINQKDKIEQSNLTRRLNNIFNKKISISMLRKSYLTNLFGKTRDIKLTEKYINTTRAMGTSVDASNLAYIKK